MPRRAVMFIDSPSSKQRRVIAAPSSGAGFFDCLVGDDLQPDQQAAAAHVADAVVALAAAQQPGRSRAPACAARAASRSRTTISITFRPTAAGSGSETCVV